MVVVGVVGALVGAPVVGADVTPGEGIGVGVIGAAVVG